MRTIELNVFNYEELSDSAKAKARDWYRQDDEGLHPDWDDFLQEDFKLIANIFGIQNFNLMYSGFSCQGDGACFTGEYTYQTNMLARIKEEFPTSETLYDIAQRLFEVQRRNFFCVRVNIKHSGRYYHKYMTDFCIERDDGKYLAKESEKEIIEALRDLMGYFYNCLETSYWELVSDKSVEESIINNEYEFYEDGSKF